METLVLKNYVDNTSQLTLLLACNSKKIVGYYVICGNANESILLNFCYDILKKYQNEGKNIHKTIFVLDNARFHKTQLCYSFFVKNNLKVIFTPCYSPEINPIEYLFQRIKRKYKNEILEAQKFVNKNRKNENNRKNFKSNFIDRNCGLYSSVRSFFKEMFQNGKPNLI